MFHNCPVQGCRVTQVESHKLMCYRHWKQVPPEIQKRVYRAWNYGKGRGTQEHREACRAAIEHVNQHFVGKDSSDGD